MFARRLITRLGGGVQGNQSLCSVGRSSQPRRVPIEHVKPRSSPTKQKHTILIQTCDACQPRQTKADSSSKLKLLSYFDLSSHFKGDLERARETLIHSAYQRKFRERRIDTFRFATWYTKGFNDGMDAQYAANEEELKRFRKWGRWAYLIACFYAVRLGINAARWVMREWKVGKRDVGREEGGEAGVVGLGLSADGK